MASIDKVKVGETTYDVSPSSTGTLSGYTSNDNVTPPAWSEVDTIASSDTNSSIFSKLTTMVKNVRWLYVKLGNDDFSGTGQSTITGALSTLQSGLDGKSPSSHTHTTATLPVSSNQVNSENYVPTSALLYSMTQKANDLMDSIYLAKRELGMYDDPNTRYESKDLGTWSSVSDVDAFMNLYNYRNFYEGISLGNYVTIQDGTYNVQWEIAGFDMEYNQTAADETVYDNGYGICMIPKDYVTTEKWNTSAGVEGGYKSSYMHNTVLPTIVTNLKTVLGTHVVNRNVLLSSSVDTSSSIGYSNAYTWTTSDATLMSVGQLTGTFASDRNKYDDGEANYKLPLFNYEDYYTGYYYWVRNIAATSSNTTVYMIYDGADVTAINASTTTRYVRPLIYLR